MTQKKIIGGAVLGLAIFSLVAGLLVKSCGTVNGDGKYSGLHKTGNGLVGIVEINGMIAGGSSSAGLFGGGVAGSETIMRQLRDVSQNPDIKAVVLRIDSPGGTPAASQEITDEVNRLKKSGIKIVTSMGDLAASGAYWIASSSDKIVANPGTITGSIGVIMETQNYRGLLDKLGVSPDTIKSGSYKDMGSPERPMTAEEKKIFQSMVDDTYSQFVETVAAGRHIDPDAIRKLNGRVLTGRQAIKDGLVDQTGNLYDAISLAGQISGLGKNPGTVYLGAQRGWLSMFSNLDGASQISRYTFSEASNFGGALLLCPLPGQNF